MKLLLILTTLRPPNLLMATLPMLKEPLLFVLALLPPNRVPTSWAKLAFKGKTISYCIIVGGLTHCANDSRPCLNGQNHQGRGGLYSTRVGLPGVDSHNDINTNDGY